MRLVLEIFRHPATVCKSQSNIRPTLNLYLAAKFLRLKIVANKNHSLVVQERLAKVLQVAQFDCN